MLFGVLTFLAAAALIGVVANLVLRFAVLAVGWKIASFVVTVLLIVALIFLIRRIFTK